ncbi:hypothetical protein DFS33DRAFT_1110144 [Desarmillaria ectypa]|nr:hypothetical protein DFS33DRAFT_1110144 [Desarmillaria ectypa]
MITTHCYFPQESNGSDAGIGSSSFYAYSPWPSLIAILLYHGDDISRITHFCRHIQFFVEATLNSRRRLRSIIDSRVQGLTSVSMSNGARSARMQIPGRMAIQVRHGTQIRYNTTEEIKPGRRTIWHASLGTNGAAASWPVEDSGGIIALDGVRRVAL